MTSIVLPEHRDRQSPQSLLRDSDEKAVAITSAKELHTDGLIIQGATRERNTGSNAQDSILRQKIG